jgi:hypothetical protein
MNMLKQLHEQGHHTQIIQLSEKMALLATSEAKPWKMDTKG